MTGPANDQPVIEATLVPEVESPPPPRPWGFWMTLLWMIAGGGVMAVAQTMGALPVMLARVTDARPRAFEQTLEELASDGLLLSVSTLVCAPVMLLFVVGVVKLTRLPVREYLGIEWPSLRALAVGLGAVIAYIAVVDSTNLLLQRPIVPEFMIKAYQTAGFLPLLLAALVAAAPLWEEVCFRGFAWRGWAASPLGPVGASVLTSLCWTALHIQYGLLELQAVFLLGILLGILRWKSGSLLLTIMLHAVLNLVAFVETAVAVELLGQ
jgi:hypothetical protein